MAAFVAFNAVLCALTVNQIDDKMAAGGVTIGVAVSITVVVYFVSQKPKHK